MEPTVRIDVIKPKMQYGIPYMRVRKTEFKKQSATQNIVWSKVNNHLQKLSFLTHSSPQEMMK